MSQFWLCYHLMQLIWVCIAFCASSKCLKNSGNMLGQVWTWLHLRMLFRNQLERSRCKLDHTFHRCLCQVVTSNRTAANPWWEITFKIFGDLLRPFNILEALLWRKSHLLPVPTSSLVVRSSPEGKHPKLPENFNIFNDSGALVLPSPKGSVERALHKGNMSKLKFSNFQAQHSTETQQAQIRIRLVEHAAQQNMWFSLIFNVCLLLTLWRTTGLKPCQDRCPSVFIPVLPIHFVSQNTSIDLSSNYRWASVSFAIGLRPLEVGQWFGGIETLSEL